MSTFDYSGKPDVITLVMKTRFPKIKRPMYCLNCGQLLQYTYKQITMVVEGIAAIESIEEEIQCRRCKVLYELS